MAYTQFGYPCPPSAAPSLTTPQLLMSSGDVSTTRPGSSTSTSCCETGRPIMTDPTTGQTICSCQYSTTSLLSTYPRVASLTDSVYGTAYAAQGYVPFGADPSAFYSPLNPSYDLKEGDAWRSLAHPAACYPYDPMSAGYPYGQSALAQRKNATREATSTLKAWLQEHIKNPYPTKGEKIMLAIITKMTLTQVSTWFANARRRLKKENKMTWSPRNRTDEDGNKLDSDDEGDDDKDSDDKKSIGGDKDSTLDVVGDKDDDDFDNGRGDLNLCSDDDLLSDNDSYRRLTSLHSDTNSNTIKAPTMTTLGPPPHGLPSSHSPLTGLHKTTSNDDLSSTHAKPRIWSLADVATSTSIVSTTTSSPLSSSRLAAPPSGHHLAQHPLFPPHHQLSLSNSTHSPKHPGDINFNPAINGFRPWMEASLAGVPGTQPSYAGPAPSPSSQAPSSGGLLRPYSLVPSRPEVH